MEGLWLKAAGVRDARLHGARHTAVTVLLVLGVTERTVMGIMGWSSTAMADPGSARHGPDLRDVARRVGAAVGRRAVVRGGQLT